MAVLKWLTCALLAYVAALFMVDVRWGDAVAGLVLPSIIWEREHLQTAVALLGTTISPYLFFWQASQEAEDVRAIPRRQILKRAPHQGEAALERIELELLQSLYEYYIAMMDLHLAAGNPIEGIRIINQQENM